MFISFAWMFYVFYSLLHTLTTTMPLPSISYPSMSPLHLTSLEVYEWGNKNVWAFHIYQIAVSSMENKNSAVGYVFLTMMLFFFGS